MVVVPSLTACAAPVDGLTVATEPSVDDQATAPVGGCVELSDITSVAVKVPAMPEETVALVGEIVR